MAPQEPILSKFQPVSMAPLGTPVVPEVQKCAQTAPSRSRRGSSPPRGKSPKVMTGTPVGTALGTPPKPQELQAFLEREVSNPKYLQHGDILEVSITTNDGAIDLGTQRTAVRYA